MRRLPFANLRSLPLMAIAAMTFCSTLSAQAAQAPGMEDQARPSMMSDIIENAGLIGWLIVVLSVIALALVIEHFMSVKRDKLAPSHLIDEIECPVYLTGAWQDEQTGGLFANMVDRFTSARTKKITMYNGRHPDGYSLLLLTRWYEFLEFYVARRVPHVEEYMFEFGGPEISKEFGVEGLGFDEEGVTFNGLPFEQASHAERVRVSTAIGLALNPNLRVLLIRDAEKLDAVGMRLIAELAEEQDAQLWLERAGHSDPGGVVFDDGEIASTRDPGQEG